MLQTARQQDNSALEDVFEPYKLDDLMMPRLKSRYLGMASLQLGSLVYSTCTFFEIAVSENSESSSSEEEEEVPSDGLDPLPPKKRKRPMNKMKRTLVFCTDKTDVMSCHQAFYTFPRNAVTECLTQMAPHKMVFSFFPCASVGPCEPMEGSFKTALEAFAAVCSNSCQYHHDGHVNNAMISNVSHELYQAIKYMVSNYEAMCQNMVALMKLHHEEVIHHKSEMVLMPEIHPHQQGEQQQQQEQQDMSPEPIQAEETQKQEEEEEEEQEAVVKEESRLLAKPKSNPNQNQIKKCLYCGSKSTPMWRRGPQGAGTLCNACGVKWKHGKILSEHPDQYTLERRPSKPERKRKKSTSKRTTKKRATSVPQQDDVIHEYYAVPTQPQVWESTSSSTSDSCSPLESPSLLLEKRQETKRDLSSIMTYDTETLSVYVGEDAVEAAAVLTLLKRS
ncbi:uncharacterized protein B0P05DRAFT_563249 [Gilbertella persicaria]|uniref:uncharacterized protein n=1 Tax=Gilbertella persicaria TaxID=101096 RepID=UPI00221FF5AB|nr:uncharacterized protein B0P05DRAFT_563249 [Gilbertella persicaria]KAI8050143.1 hypothetical protein B0P05DRAFT_563249 [Gilbertella persicaria]